MYQTSIRNKKKNKQLKNTVQNNYELDQENEEYAHVIKMLGNCRVSLLTNTGKESIGIIRGTLRKFTNRIIIEKGDIVVISKRGYQDNKVDIVHKYNREQIQTLISEKKFSNTLLNSYINNKNTYIENKYDKDNDNILSIEFSDFINDDRNDDINDNNNEINNNKIENNSDYSSDDESDLFKNTNYLSSV
jgi:translation initiation factor 1A|tara:strand:- start:10328 stop:10897 length:570 start_codon:yes stop_codon:yes gene_type:complete